MRGLENRKRKCEEKAFLIIVILSEGLSSFQIYMLKEAVIIIIDDEK